MGFSCELRSCGRAEYTIGGLARSRAGSAMEFGVFSNGFRPHTTAAKTYDEDLYELVLADQLGFRDAWISEHHGEPVYIDKVDTCPIPEMLMCKAAALTKRLRMGAAINVIHLAHPV